MSSFFVPKDEVPVTLDDESVPFEERNIIYIKPKMDFGTRQKVTSAFAHITNVGTGEQQSQLDMGAYNSALLHHNIVRWQGPGFQAMPCTPENIDRLDPDLPLLDAVLTEINARNTPDKGKTDPNSPRSGFQSGSTRKPGKSQSHKGQ